MLGCCATAAGRVRAAVLAVSLFGGTTGCGTEAPPAPGWTERDSAGIVIAENDHTRPAWTPETAWRLGETPVLRIGTVSGDTTQQLYQVTDAERLSDGRIAVVNQGSAEVRLYDATGNQVGVIGRRGDGPGELRFPWRVHELRGDSILVVDLYRAVSIFDASGRFVRRFSPEPPESSMAGEGVVALSYFGDASLLALAYHREDPSRRGLGRSRITMMRVGLDGSTDVLGEFDDQTVLYGGDGAYLFGARAMEAASDTTMWYGPGDRFEIREVGLDGRVLRLVRLDRPRRRVTDADVEQHRTALLARVRGTPEEEIVNRRMASAQWPETFPAHLEILTDAEGNVWVQDYQPFTLRVERSWSVFSQQGHYLGNVIVPAGLTVRRIGSDYVLGVWRDELDVEYVLMYALEKGLERSR